MPDLVDELMAKCSKRALAMALSVQIRMNVFRSGVTEEEGLASAMEYNATAARYNSFLRRKARIDAVLNPKPKRRRKRRRS